MSEKEKNDVIIVEECEIRELPQATEEPKKGFFDKHPKIVKGAKYAGAAIGGLIAGLFLGSRKKEEPEDNGIRIIDLDNDEEIPD